MNRQQMEFLEQRRLLSAAVAPLAADINCPSFELPGNAISIDTWTKQYNAAGKIQRRALLNALPQDNSPQVPLSQVPQLSSRPGAGITIYLDFDGSPAFTWTNNAGTFHVSGPAAGDSDPVPAFTIDNNANDFNANELTAINQIWACAAEKYSPFNVNVTTVNPGNDNHNQTVHVIFGGSTNDWYHQNAGGVGAIGGFSDPTLGNQCFMFSADAIAAGTTALAASTVVYLGTGGAHETGHEFGLHHETNTVNGVYSEYYDGDADHSPVMGNAGNDYTARGMWWKTGNWGQTSTSPAQDELSLLSSTLGYRSDDYTLAFPGSLGVGSNGAFSGGGLIETAGDSDYFVVRATSNRASITVKNASFGGMLQPDVYIYRKSDNASVPFDVSYSNTSVTLNTSGLTSGSDYYVVVHSFGDYGDIGQYAISGAMQTFAGYQNGIAGDLIVGGLAGNNNVTIGASDYQGNFTVSDVVNGHTTQQTFNSAYTSSIDVLLGNGADAVDVSPVYTPSFNAAIPVNIDTGSGSDVVSFAALSSTSVYTINSSALTYKSIYSDPALTYSFTSVERINLHNSNAGDTVNVNDWQRGQYLYDYGGSGDDVLNLSNGVTSARGYDIWFYGNAGNDTMSLSNYGDTYGRQYVIADGTVDFRTNGYERKCHYDTAVEHVSLSGTAYDDEFYVANASGPTQISLVGSQGNDKFFFGYDDPFDYHGAGHYSDRVLSPVFVYGSSGDDQILIDDSAAPTSTTYGLTYAALISGLTATSSAGTASLTSYLDNEHFTLRGSNVGSNYNVYGTSSFAPATIQTGTGNNLIHIFGTSGACSVIGNTGNDYFTFGAAGSPAAIAPGMLIDGGGGANTLTVYMSPSPATITDTTYNNLTYLNCYSVQFYAPNAPLAVAVQDLIVGQSITLIGSAYETDVTIAAANSNRGGRVTGGLYYIPGTGRDVININDGSDAADTTWTVSGSQVVRVDTPPQGDPPDNGTQLDVFIGNPSALEQLNIAGGSGNDDFKLTGNPKLASISGGAGDDLFEIPSTQTFTNLTVDGGDGFDRLVTTSTLTNIPYTFWEVDADHFYDARFGGTSTYSTYYYGGLEALELHGADTLINHFAVVSTDTTLYLYGGSQDDTFTVGAQTTAAIQAEVQIEPIAGQDSLTIDDASATNGVVAHIGPHEIGAAVGDSLFGPGGFVQYFSLASVNVNLGSGDDTVYARLNPTAAVNIDGGEGSDNLGLALADAADYSQTDNGDGTGEVSASGFGPLDYAAFEATSVDDVAPSVLSADFNWDGPRQSVDVQFSEDVSAALNTGYFIITNTATGAQLSDGDLQLTYDVDTNTAHITFPNFTYGALANGDYSLALQPNIPDRFGNVTGEETDLNFFSLAGDANHDGKVDVADLGILASNWQTSGRTFATGDFNFDGVVNIADLGILASNWQSGVDNPNASPFSTAVAQVGLGSAARSISKAAQAHANA